MATKHLKAIGCMYCSSTFWKPEDLYAHFLKEHPDKRQSAAPVTVPKVEDHMCICFRRFKTRGGLERHSNKEHQKPLL